MALLEKQIIENYFSNLNNFSQFQPQNINYLFEVSTNLDDDCASIKNNLKSQLVFTTDALNQGVHFPIDIEPDNAVQAKQVAYKALQANLSDLAANAAIPLAFTLSINLPSKFKQDRWLTGFRQGLQQAINYISTPFTLIGGDTCTAHTISIVITCIGYLKYTNISRTLSLQEYTEYEYLLALSTEANKPLGLAKIVLDKNYDKLNNSIVGKTVIEEKKFIELQHFFYYPQARIALSQQVIKNITYYNKQQIEEKSPIISAACIDISDGFLLDLKRLLIRNFQQSLQCTLNFQANNLIFPNLNKENLPYFCFGEDYELLYLFAIPKATINYTKLISKINQNQDTAKLEIIGKINKNNNDENDSSNNKEIQFVTSIYKQERAKQKTSKIAKLDLLNCHQKLGYEH